MAYKLFLSHGREDKPILDESFRALLRETDASVFIDDEAIKNGDDFHRIIFENLRLCDEVLLLLTPSSSLRPWVWAETGASLIGKKPITVIKYYIREQDLNGSGVRSLLSTCQFAEFENLQTYLQDLKNRVGQYKCLKSLSLMYTAT